MLVLVDLEVDNSIFIVTEENNNFELCIFPDEKSAGASYIKVRDEIEKDLDVSDITAAPIQQIIIGSIVIEEYRKQAIKRMKDDNYMRILAIFVSSVFQDFERIVRTEIDFVEENIKLVLDEYNSIVITHDLEPGIDIFKGLPEAIITFFILNVQDLLT